MALYVDGFLLPVPKRKVEAYRRMSAKAGKIWRELGALEYRECVGDDLKTAGAGLRRGVKLKAGEAVVFSWIVYRSRAQRDRIVAKIMKDPRIMALCKDGEMPFDVRRMAYGGFRVLVDE
jgi:uncharacterized protein YbaA (DUF1428 family)